MKTAHFLLCLVAVAIYPVIGSPPLDDGRIVNGMRINIKQAPYIVRLVKGGRGFCGGSLVAPDYVVTAAHCVHGIDMSKVTVVANATTIFDAGIRRTVSNWAVHPDYNDNDMHTDIAVIKLNEPIENITTIPLSEQPVKENDTIQVSGWGRMAENSTGSTYLNTVFLPVRSKEACNKEFHRFVEKNMFCASGLDNKSACLGDSGGPAVFNGTLCGVVAFSYHCGQVGYSDAYTDVFATKYFIKYFIWINST